jgi:hypothetical protein
MMKDAGETDGEFWKDEDEECCCRGNDEWGERSERVFEAVHESVRRFVKVNEENIRKSSKEQIAESSYGGGMIDMIGVIRNALGNWALEQLLIELEEWQRADDAEDDSAEEVLSRNSPSSEGVSQRDATEPVEKIDRWMQERKRDGRTSGSDPMFA